MLWKQCILESNMLHFLRGTWKNRGKGGYQQAKVLLGQGQAPGTTLSAAQSTHSVGKSQKLQHELSLAKAMLFRQHSTNAETAKTRLY